MRRIGLVGLGHVARHHVRGIAATPDLTLAATADLQPRSDTLATLDCPHFGSLSELLGAVSPDAVIIATPPATHLALAEEALNAGVDTLLEKPATPSRHAFTRLNATASASDARLDVALHAAFGQEMLWFDKHKAELVDRFGPPLSAICQFRDPYLTDTRVTPEAIGLGGSWLDSGINALSVLDRVLPMSEAKVADALFSHLEAGLRVDIQAQVSLSWETGSARIETDWQTGENLKRTEILFADGTSKLLLHHSGEYAEIRSSEGSQRIDLGTHHERLTNHYISLFAAYSDLPGTGGGFGGADNLHSLLFDAIDAGPDLRGCS